MNRRTQASLLALGLLVASVVAMVVQPVPWVIYSPGPTLNVLGEYDGKPIVDVRGRKEYRDEGALRLLTVISTGPDEEVELLAVVGAWLDGARSVYPHDAIYAPQDTQKSVRQESQAQMSSSQDNARAAALQALEIEFERWVGITSVDAKGAAHGELAVGDRLTAVDGRPTPDVATLFDEMTKVRPGRDVAITFTRDGVAREVTLTTRKHPDDPERAVIGVGIKQEFRFPFEMDLNISENIGGPSAGLMFSVAIYDVLTKGSLTAGKQIAGTGEIDASGTVLPIGGVRQKIAAAERDDARLFLVPKENCAEALTADWDHDKMRLVRADEVEQAIDQIEKWADNPRAELTECTR